MPSDCHESRHSHVLGRGVNVDESVLAVDVAIIMPTVQHTVNGAYRIFSGRVRFAPAPPAPICARSAVQAASAQANRADDADETGAVGTTSVDVCVLHARVLRRYPPCTVSDAHRLARAFQYDISATILVNVRRALYNSYTHSHTYTLVGTRVCVCVYR